MSAELFYLKTARVIDQNGIADGSTLTFYLSGTSTLTPVYTTQARDTEHPNPLTVAAGAALPDIYLDPEVSYRCVVENSDGDGIDDIDPYLGLSSLGVMYTEPGSGAVSRTAQAKLRDQFVSIEGYRQSGDGNDYLPALRRALAASTRVVFPEKADGYTFVPGSAITLAGDTIIDFNGQIATGGSGILMEFAAPQLSGSRTLSSGATVGDKSIVITNATDVLPGDIVTIHSTQIPLPLHATDQKRDTVRVVAKSGSTLTLAQALNFTWTTGDAGLAVYVFRPVRLTTRGFNYDCQQVDGTTTAFVGMRVTGCVDVTHENPVAVGVLPFTRTIDTDADPDYENIYRTGIQHYYCIGITLLNPVYDKMSYGAGCYGGGRNVREFNVKSNYCRHSGCDMGQFSDGYWLEGMVDTGSGRALSSHACINWNANNASVVDNLLLSAVRAVGASHRNSKIETAADDDDTPYNDGGATASGFEYLYNGRPFEYENLTLVNPSRTVYDIDQRHGASVLFKNVRSVDARVADGVPVRFVDCKFNTSERAAPPVNLIGTTSARTGQTPLLDAVPLVHLAYDAESAGFAAGETVTGGTSGATGLISQVFDSGSSGYLVLTGVSGAFQNDESLTGSLAGAATADGASAAVYHINPRAVMVNQSQGRVLCQGLIAKNDDTDPAVLSIRIHTNCFAGLAQSKYTIGTIKLVARVLHQSAGLFSTIGKKFNFCLNVPATSALVFPTTAIGATGASGQSGEDITLTVGNTSYGGETQVGSNGDHFVQFDATINSSQSAPSYSLSYELELVDVDFPV